MATTAARKITLQNRFQWQRYPWQEYPAQRYPWQKQSWQRYEWQTHPWQRYQWQLCPSQRYPWQSASIDSAFQLADRHKWKSSDGGEYTTCPGCLMLCVPTTGAVRCDRCTYMAEAAAAPAPVQHAPVDLFRAAPRYVELPAVNPAAVAASANPAVCVVCNDRPVENFADGLCVCSWCFDVLDAAAPVRPHAAAAAAAAGVARPAPSSAIAAPVPERKLPVSVPAAAVPAAASSAVPAAMPLPRKLPDDANPENTKLCVSCESVRANYMPNGCGCVCLCYNCAVSLIRAASDGAAVPPACPMCRQPFSRINALCLNGVPPSDDAAAAADPV